MFCQKSWFICLKVGNRFIFLNQLYVQKYSYCFFFVCVLRWGVCGFFLVLVLFRAAQTQAAVLSSGCFLFFKGFESEMYWGFHWCWLVKSPPSSFQCKVMLFSLTFALYVFLNLITAAVCSIEKYLNSIKNRHIMWWFLPFRHNNS